MQADTTTPFHFAFGTPTLTSNDDHLHTIAAELRSRRHAAAAAPAAAPAGGAPAKKVGVVV